MIIRNLKEIRASDRNIKADGWDSARMLVADDGMGFSFHMTTLRAGSEIEMHYKNHLESVMVLKGSGALEDLDTGEVHQLRPGVLYALNAHDRHVVRPETDILTACVFNPPVTGDEVHDETGAYPAAEAARDSATAD
jgi:L-ectoine synthase